MYNGERDSAMDRHLLIKQSLQPTDRSNTGTLQAKGQCDRRKVRALKAGQMTHLKTNAYVKVGARPPGALVTCTTRGNQ